MVQISISDISKNPSIIDKFNDVVEILNKKTKKVKGVFIPYELLDNFTAVFEELEYQKFTKRNKNLKQTSCNDDTILDGLSYEY